MITVRRFLFMYRWLHAGGNGRVASSLKSLALLCGRTVNLDGKLPLRL